MNVNSYWMRRRWLDFRNGHSTYLIFVIQFVQFLVITYTLAIERLPGLETVFTSMTLWAAFFLAVYVPAAILIGHYHRKMQLPTETEMLVKVNPYIYKVQPGREKLFQMPFAKLTLDAQIKNMEIQNAIIDRLQELSKMVNAPQKSMPKWDPDFFSKFDEASYIAGKLTDGENIVDIMQSLKKSMSKEDAEGGTATK